MLADTHIALWALYEPSRLSGRAKEALEDPVPEKFVSHVSVWEVAVKHQARPDKMQIPPGEFAAKCEQAGFRLLPIELRSFFDTETLPYDAKGTFGHKDPFDRLLLTQARTEEMSFLTHDESLSGYGLPFVRVV